MLVPLLSRWSAAVCTIDVELRGRMCKSRLTTTIESRNVAVIVVVFASDCHTFKRAERSACLHACAGPGKLCATSVRA